MIADYVDTRIPLKKPKKPKDSYTMRKGEQTQKRMDNFVYNVELF